MRLYQSSSLLLLAPLLTAASPLATTLDRPAPQSTSVLPASLHPSSYLVLPAPHVRLDLRAAQQNGAPDPAAPTPESPVPGAPGPANPVLATPSPTPTAPATPVLATPTLASSVPPTPALATPIPTPTALATPSLATPTPTPSAPAPAPPIPAAPAPAPAAPAAPPSGEIAPNAAVPNAGLQPTQVSPVTTLMQWYTPVPGAPAQQRQVIYTQVFEKVPDQWEAPRQGVIGLGTIKGSVGAVKTAGANRRRDAAPTAVPEAVVVGKRDAEADADAFFIIRPGSDEGGSGKPEPVLQRRRGKSSGAGSSGSEGEEEGGVARLAVAGAMPVWVSLVVGLAAVMAW